MDFLAQQGMHDARWDALVQSFTTRNRAGRLQTAFDLAAIAAIYLDHQHHWCEFEDAHGIVRPHRGRLAVSKFQPVCRHVCGLGIGGDETGRASQMAAVLDAWAQTTIAPAEIPAWIAGTKGGIRAIYDKVVHPTPGGVVYPPARNDNVYTGNVLPRRIVEYLPIGPDDFCVDACRGRGAFYNVLPEGRRDWCEIHEGRNFLSYEFGRQIDWIMTNPPWAAIYGEIARRAFRLADHVVFLVKLDVAINTYARQKAWREAGHGLREIHIIPWKDAEFVNEDGTAKLPEGFCLALVWWTRGWPDLFEYRLDQQARLAEAAG